MTYEYAYEGRDRLAMEGLEIYVGSLVLATGKTLPKAKPAGEWNRVRWELVRTDKPADNGRIAYEAKLFFNGDFIGQWPAYATPEHAGPELMLEVVEGQFRFANVVFRELKKVKRAAP